MTPPLGFLRSFTQRQGPLALRPASPDDYDAIQDLLDTAARTYSGLGGAMREALHQDVALTAWQDERLAGFLLAYQQGPEAAWIHGFGLAADVSQDTIGDALLQELERTLLKRGVTWIGYMDEYRLGWIRRLLERAGFHHRTRVISYEMPLQTPPTRGNRRATIRPATAADLPAVAQLDRAAFGPLWAYHEQVFRAVLGEVAYFQAAELDGEVAGYILCTTYQRDRVHIVRLAVAPHRQGQGVGARLLADAYTQFERQGLRWVSLNTQEENARSQQLYHWFGFRPTGEEMGVWAKCMTQDA
jgi:ribosomal-protein-alanine N-acetyltransferase